MSTSNRTSRLRLIVLQALVFSLFATLGVRLWYLQVDHGSSYRAQAASQSVRDVVQQPTRGLIVDDMGRPLVSNRTAWVVSLDKTTLGNLSEGDRSTLLALPGFKGRGAQRYASTWVKALQEARGLPEDELPLAAARYDGPPPPRAWADRDPVAAARLSQARATVQELAGSLDVPVENLLTPDYLRRVLWQPPEDGAAAELARLGARPWQVELTASILDEAIAAHPPA